MYTTKYREVVYYENYLELSLNSFTKIACETLSSFDLGGCIWVLVPKEESVGLLFLRTKG